MRLEGFEKMRDMKSTDSKSSSGSSSGSFSPQKYLRILCVLILVLFTWYLIDHLTGSIENVHRRWLSNRVLNLDVKLSLLFEISHLLSLPFVLYSLGKDIFQGELNET